MNHLNHLRYTILTLVTAALLLNMTSCHQGRSGGGNTDADSLLALRADSILELAIQAKDTALTYRQVDSFLNLGHITPMKADLSRGRVHILRGEFPPAIKLMRKVVEAYKKTGKGIKNYCSAAINLASLLQTNKQYEDALNVALPALSIFENNPEVSIQCMGDMLSIIGWCQLALNHADEAAKSYERAYQYWMKFQRQKDCDPICFKECINGMTNLFISYSINGDMDSKLKWVERTDEMLGRYRQLSQCDSTFADWVTGQLWLSRVEVLLSKDKLKEAAQAYDEFLKTSYAKTNSGRINSCNYLVNAKVERYAEAADIFQDYDRWATEWGLTDDDLETIRYYLNHKFQYNYNAERMDTAMDVAVRMSVALDAAIDKKNQSDAAELATIYETQQKETQIARQQAELSEQRLWGAAIVFLLITIFFIIYTIHRRRAARRLAEMKAAQERIESELRIARDIQMSMVPSQFPDYPGLDMYASMTPAKEVGGDLYGYVLMGDLLYFAVGDVSGKGVPASLFMAQATRLFRTLATQGMKPAEICTRMNEALSGEDNESGMFVTFFLGLINLTTGHLDFCNAGHNPPVIAPSPLPRLGEATAASKLPLQSEGVGGRLSFLSMEPNAPIGLWSGLEYVGEEIANIKGRLLFIYTDGLNEAENEQQEQFGDDKLLDILSSINDPSSPLPSRGGAGVGSAQLESAEGESFTAHHVIDLLTAAVEQHRHGAEPNDDLTMMCVKVNY